MTTLYLSTIGTTPEMHSLASFKDEAMKPSVLMSFYFLPQVKKAGEELYRNVRGFKCMLDSGAFTAKSKNKVIDIDALVAEIKDGKWQEAAALDVIGDPEASYRNAMVMREKGATQAFPTFHFGEPWEYLKRYAAEFDKVGLGGLVPVKNAADRNAWLGECFARIWPKKTHGFGVMGEDSLMRFPFHSVDSTSWEAAALRFGLFQFTKGQSLGLNRPKARAAMGGSELYLRPEVQHYMRMERRVQARWRTEFVKQGWL